MKTIKPNDVVLGYTLRTRIGSGGYGEVWSAEAPGGMMKAVKFVYGFHDEARARTELKALDRIKLVRHPFLLSLERIQVVSGQLIVITELADKSLADMFRETKTASGTGIPRADLLQYMRDAADGLDYLSQTHSLQHLDIKPENLLLLSGHVKIADFGLVKEVHDATQSLMNGLTPIYAPPELFDGRPHRNSDQYSLAIVYQEMLTGTRPFTGTSAAQLAAQHINGRPALQALPAKDQPVIFRALSKDPSVRYNSCRELIDELVERKSRVKAKRALSAPELRTETTLAGCVMDETPRRGFTSRVSESNFPYSATHLVNLPPLDLAGAKAVARPTLIVGVGQTAARVLTRIRQRLVQQFGGAASTPAIALLCLDTDVPMLSKMTHPPGEHRLRDSDILPIPLKTSEQYRQVGQLKWNWLSRRWIYNIPRSGQSEGLRPLGRLAFADHSVEILRRLKDIVADITKPESVAATAETIGLDPEPDRVNVVFVTSSAGGVGSGMTIDLAYAIRAILHEKGCDDIRLTGLLLHATPRGQNEQVLAIANSVSLLTEIRHFNQFGYPGDESCGMPSFEDDPVFDHTYLLHMGEGLSSPAFEDGINRIGEYVFLTIASDCQSYLEKCRAQGSSNFRSASIRSYGLSQHDAFDEMSRALAEAVAQRWLQVDQARMGFAADQCVESIRAERNLLPAQVCRHTAPLAARQIEAVREAWRHEIRDKYAKTGMDECRRRVEQLVQGLFEQFGLTSECGNSKASLELRTALEKQADQVAKELNEQLWSLVSQPIFRVGGAGHATSRLIHQLRCDVEQQRKFAAHAKSRQQETLQSARLKTAANKKSDQSPPAWAQWCEQYLAASVEHFEAELAAQFLARISAALAGTETALLTAAGELARRLDVCMPRDFGDPDFSSRPEVFPVPQIKVHIRNKLGELAERVDAHLQHGWLHDSGGLTRVISDPLHRYGQLPRMLMAACNTVISSVPREISLRNLAAAGGMSPVDLAAWLSAQLEESKPQLADGHGEIRLMIAHAGNEQTREALRDLKDHQPLQPTFLEHTPGDLVFCQELQEIPFAQLIYRLLEGRNDALDLAARLHSRTDVDWSSLNDLFQMS